MKMNSTTFSSRPFILGFFPLFCRETSVKALIAAGARVDALTQSGRTALQLAQERGNANRVAALQPEIIGAIHTEEAFRQSKL